MSMKLAQTGDQQFNLAPGTGFGSLTNISFGDIVSALIQAILVIASILFFFMLVLGGLKWVTSGGDKTKTEEARGQITAALVGLVIIFSAWAILQIIGAFFGVNLTEFNLTIGG